MKILDACAQCVPVKGPGNVSLPGAVAANSPDRGEICLDFALIPS
jgi:hypothetical protein